jgi:hypothetical protein
MLFRTTLSAIIFSYSAANADVITCRLSEWQGGASQEVSISWLGTEFEINVDADSVRQKFSFGYTGWTRGEKIESRDFFTIRYDENINSDSSTLRYRASFRAYNDGTSRCSVRLSSARYMDLYAEGLID